MSGIDPYASQDKFPPKYIDKACLPFLKQWWRNLNQRLFANTYVFDQLNNKTEEKYFGLANPQVKYPGAITPGYLIIKSTELLELYHCQYFNQLNDYLEL